VRWPSGRCACLRAGPAPARAHGRRWAGVLLVCAHGRRPARRRTWGLPAAARSPALVAHWLQAVLNRRPGSRAALRPPSFPRASPAHRLKGARRPPSARGSARDRLLCRHQVPFEALSTMVSSWCCSKYSRSLRGHAYPGRFDSRRSSTQSGARSLYSALNALASDVTRGNREAGGGPSPCTQAIALSRTKDGLHPLILRYLALSGSQLGR
jgi:hypothetical protein